MRRILPAWAVVLFLGAAVAADEHFRLAPDAAGQIPYFIDAAVDGSGARFGDAELAAWALQEWRRSVGGSLRFRAAADAGAARLRIRCLPWADDAALGRMQPTPVSGASSPFSTSGPTSRASGRASCAASASIR
jgi:hypothetical protein